ncbi:T9SS type A sorting domain-containing protein [Chryseobacterium paridis]|uniref:T9SS type A sorting domain-containing protein n=1 Tax=Chryseobacterium paridis TaxID=2800328 RepID=A0ABS1FTI2_9FLAO|nr:T9SS type A sorting domain-containing protein [Chryseobacterium paridis]MBK1895725.1 T9SS type A sorting domain-containing protein [Chryseobacterium paridis]
MRKLFLLFVLFVSLMAYQSYSGQAYPVATCSVGVSSNTYGPMNSNSTADSKNRTAFILRASQLDAISNGTITSTYFRRLSSSGTLNNTANFKIYLKNTTMSDFGSGSPDWATEIGTATLVYDSNPDTAVGSTAGFKQFLHTANFVYTAGSNLAVYLEYTQTTAQASTIGWDYEYGTTCINTGNSNTTKYLNTTGAFGATLTSSNYRRPVIGFDANVPPPTTVPACTTISAPTNAATGVSVTPTITWAATSITSSYLVSVGTTPGGTDVMNAVDVGNVTTYSIPTSTPLNYSTQYYVTVVPKNVVGPATGCTGVSFTTRNIVCPTVSAPTAGATGQSLTPTITWASVATATGYKLSVGTTAGGTDILNNQDLGNVTTYTFATPLTTSTTYYYTVNSYNANSASASCTERTFSTICGATNVPYNQDFESVTTPALPACTSLENAGTGNNWTTYSSAGGSFNTKVLNYTYNSTNAANAWFYTQGINLTAGTSYRIKYIYGNASGTTYPEKLKVAYGTSASSAAMTTVLADYPNVTNGTTAISEIIDFIPTATGVYYFGFNAYSTADQNRLYVDNININVTPVCTEPSALTTSNITTTGATISWTAPTTAPNTYEYAFTTTNVAPASGTTTSATTANLGPLTAQTAYYAWVRSNCTAGNSSWIQVAFTTLALPPANDDCSNAINLVPGGTFAQNAVTGTTVGSTNTPALPASCLSTPTNVAGNVWYKVTVPASGNITIESDAVTGSALTDTVMSIFADCTGANSIMCDDDTGNGNFSKVSLTGQTPGTILYVSLWRYSNAGGGSDGQFQISAYDASLLGTSEVSGSKNDLKVYPNPFSDILNISDISKVKSVSVSDIAGRLVKTITNPGSALQLGELKSGMYLVTLEMKDGSKQTIKTIKK